MSSPPTSSCLLPWLHAVQLKLQRALYVLATLMRSVHDGWGLSDNEKGNAIFHGDTTHMDAIRDKHNFVELEAHGLAVGLKEGLMGNSEVG